MGATASAGFCYPLPENDWRTPPNGVGKERRGMLARMLVAVGVVAAAVGFSFFGIATSTYEFYDRAGDLGIALMVGGGVAALVGGFWYRAQERGLP